jgi:hypothetical protein
MVFLPPCTNAGIALVMYNDTRALSSLLIRATSFLNSVIVMSLYIFDCILKVDGVACLIDTCWVKNPDHAFALQFYIVHEFHPT